MPNGPHQGSFGQAMLWIVGSIIGTAVAMGLLIQMLFARPVLERLDKIDNSLDKVEESVKENSNQIHRADQKIEDHIRSH